MNEAKQAHVGLLPLVGGAVLPAYDSPRLRSAARPPVSVGDLDRQPADSHPQPLNENRSIVFWDSFFDRHVLGTVIRVRSRISDYPIDTERGRGVGCKWKQPAGRRAGFQICGQSQSNAEVCPHVNGELFCER